MQSVSEAPTRQLLKAAQHMTETEAGALLRSAVESKHADAESALSQSQATLTNDALLHMVETLDMHHIFQGTRWVLIIYIWIFGFRV